MPPRAKTPEIDPLDPTIAGSQEDDAPDLELQDEAQSESWTDREQAYAEAREEIAAEAAVDPMASIDAIFALPQVQERVRQITAQSVENAVAAATSALGAQLSAMLNPSKPALAMRANVADTFITKGNAPKGSGNTPFLKHFRCERLKSTKVLEYDMRRLQRYLDDPDSIPTDKEGRTRSPRSLCVIAGSWISFLNGHCYAFTENQVAQLMWMKTLPVEDGGLPDMYEDIGSTLWRCNLCPAEEPWGNREGYDLHMYNVHGVVPQPYPGAPVSGMGAGALSQQPVSPNPFGTLTVGG